MSFSQRIRLVRGNLTQDKFAKLVKINPNTFRNYEKGDSLPNIEVAARICEELEINPTWLMTGEGPMNTKEALEQAQIDKIRSIQDLKTDAVSGSNELEDLRQDNRELRQDNRELRLENKDLRQENRDLRDENRQLRESRKQNHFAPKTEQNDLTKHRTDNDQYDLKGASP